MSNNVSCIAPTTIFYTTNAKIFASLSRAFTRQSVANGQKNQNNEFESADERTKMRIFNQANNKRCAIIKIAADMENEESAKEIVQDFIAWPGFKECDEQVRIFAVDFVSWESPKENVRHILYPRALEEKTFVCNLGKFGGKLDMDVLAKESQKKFNNSSTKLQSLIRICNTVTSCSGEELAVPRDNLLAVTYAKSNENLLDAATSAVMGEVWKNDNNDVRNFVIREMTNVCLRLSEMKTM